MKYKIICTILLILLSIIPALDLTAAEKIQGIHRLTLKDDKPKIQLSQRFSVEIINIPNDRRYIFVELISLPDDEYRLKILPTTVNLSYRLIDHFADLENQQMAVNRGGSWQVLRPSLLETNTKSYYLEDTVVYFKFIENEAANIDSNFIITPTNLTISTPGNEFNLIFNDQAIIDNLSIDVKNNISLPLPADLELLSSIYQFDIFAKENIDLTFPITIKIGYTGSRDSTSKAIYYYDKGLHRWIRLPSYNHLEDNYVQAIIHLPDAPIAILSDQTSEDGIASWYAYKNCNCAASRDYPKGSQVKVTRLKSGDSVIVTINDYGPEEWTGRLIDLDQTAFQQIGSLRAGLIYVNVEPYD